MPFNSKKMPLWQIITLSFLGLIIVYKVWDLVKNVTSTGKSIVSDIEHSSQVQGVKDAINQSGINDIRAQDVQDVAESIYSAFYKDSFFGFGEDEPKAIEALNSLQSLGECKAVARIYKVNFKKSLHDDFIKYCHGKNFTSIKTSYLTAIKGI